MTAPTILAYHAVDTVPTSGDPYDLFVAPSRFADQMQFLSRQREVVTLRDAVDGARRGRRPHVAITFDDGYRCLLEHALPVLEELGLPATVFVPTGFIGDRNRWDAPPTDGLEIMSRDQLRDAEQRGLAVESHGHRHLDLPLLSEAAATEDLRQGVEALRELLGRAPEFLAYPFGATSPGVQQMSERLAFRAAFTIAARDTGPFARARVPVLPDDSARTFRLKTSGYFPALRYSRVAESIRAATRLGRRR